MGNVHVVQHSYQVGDSEETKLIGVYASREAAESAVRRLSLLPGFRDRPANFTIDELELDRDHWTEGFVSLAVILVPSGDDAEPVPMVAEILDGGVYRLLPSPGTFSTRFLPGDLVRCRPASSDDATPIAFELADRSHDGAA